MKQRNRTEQELAYSLDNTEAESLALFQIAANILQDADTLLNDSATDSAAIWERVESKMTRLERAIYRLKLDARQHAMRASIANERR